MMPKVPKVDYDAWLLEHIARHTEWDRLAAEMESAIEKELDQKYPPAHGWIGRGRSVRIRPMQSPDTMFYGDFI